MLKCLPLLCCFTSIPETIHIQSPKHATQLMVSQHTKTFGQENLFLHQKNKNDINEWLVLLDAIDLYIKKNNATKYSELSQVLCVSYSLSNHLAETLSNAYKIYQCPTTDKNLRKNLIDGYIDNISSKLSQFETLKKFVKTASSSEQLKSPVFKKSLSGLLAKNSQDLAIKDIYDMLYHLVATLEATYQKSIKDWQAAAITAGLKDSEMKDAAKPADQNVLEVVV